MGSHFVIARLFFARWTVLRENSAGARLTNKRAAFLVVHGAHSSVGVSKGRAKPGNIQTVRPSRSIYCKYIILLPVFSLMFLLAASERGSLDVPSVHGGGHHPSGACGVRDSILSGRCFSACCVLYLRVRHFPGRRVVPDWRIRQSP